MEENKEPTKEPVEANNLGHQKSKDHRQQDPKKIIGSYAEMTDLIDLKRQLGEIIFASHSGLSSSPSYISFGSASNSPGSSPSLTSPSPGPSLLVPPRSVDSSPLLLPAGVPISTSESLEERATPHLSDSKLLERRNFPTPPVSSSASFDVISRTPTLEPRTLVSDPQIYSSNVEFHSSKLKQFKGNCFAGKVINPLTACLCEIDFLLENQKENDDIVYPDSRIGDSKKYYKGTISVLRGLVSFDGKPDFNKRQDYLIKILVDSVQAQITLMENEYAEEKKKQKRIEDKYTKDPHKFARIQKMHQRLNNYYHKLYNELLRFCANIVNNNSMGKTLKWESTHKKDPFLAVYKQECEAIKLRLNKAAHDLAGLKETPDLTSFKNQLSNIQETIDDHSLNPRAKLAKIYVFAKKAEHTIKKQCKQILEDEIVLANAKSKESYLNAQKNVDGIRLPLNTCDFSVLPQPTEQIQQAPVVAAEAPLLISDEAPDSIVPKPQLAVPGKFALVAATSKHIDDYENKDSGFSWFFTRSSSAKRIKVANNVREQALALIEDDDAGPKLKTFISSLEIEQKKLEMLNDQRHWLANLLSYLPNFLFSKEIRLLTTIKMIRKEIVDLANQDDDLKNAIKNAQESLTDEYKPMLHSN